MDLVVKTHNCKLTDAMREYIDARAAKLDRVNERITEAKLELREEPSHRDGARFVAQFTIATRRAILRAETQGTEMRSAIDLVIDKMNRQIRRFHDRKIRRNRRDAVNLGVLAADQTTELETEEPDTTTDGSVVRMKRFKIQPMDTLEAVEQIELLGHDFYLFYNADTSQLNVLYRRRDGQFGLIVPELA